ncbi:hypothetical protein ABNQ38_14295 (plasmid) [Azospirillum sp. A29]
MAQDDLEHDHGGLTAQGEAELPNALLAMGLICSRVLRMAKIFSC